LSRATATQGDWSARGSPPSVARAWSAASIGTSTNDLGNVPGFHQLEVGEYPGKRLGGRFHLMNLSDMS
jgi:hypothetical protein